MKTAIVADWLLTYAGAERVLEKILQIFPQADLYSVVDFVPDEERGFLLGKNANTTFIQHLPRAKRSYRHYLPLMPLAVEQLDLTGYDLILSSSHAVAKGVLVGPDQLHISYVHSPMRYAWDLQHQYLRESGLSTRKMGWVARLVLHYMRMWDSRTANGVDQFIANSDFIARRIRRVYGRESAVVYPPVDVEGFSLVNDKENFFLTASRMVPYKKMDLIVEAFSRMPDRQLVVIGDGPDAEKIRRKAAANVKILGYQPTEVLRDHMQRAKAFVFAAEEDFGIAPVEAQACGTPVIAFGKGGALETIRGLDSPAPTGVHFGAQTVESIVAAVEEFERNSDRITPAQCRANAERFSASRFREEFLRVVEAAIQSAGRR